ncbi:MAG: peptidase M16 [Gammaproteobacteria bacterium]|nr:MAG: peptidase M16 [Gammaproteobacteria bacterium]
MSVVNRPENIHPAFEWLRSERIESLNIVIEEYHHKATGACHFHMAADNQENVFLVALRTVPQDSTGVAHILEHTVLCGSERFPVRDPFFMMTRRSLNTFMNAFTSSDWTAYPFASQNRKDFDNLLDVYLDAVFFSRLHELDFAQEGHRLEFDKPADPDSNLVFKGVVFNEMKGAMSSPVSTLWQSITKHLFPTTTYHYNSGGEPENIPDLTYDQLKAFYQTHYHPSNAIFMTFGDIPAYEHHQQFEEKALKRFSKLDCEIRVGLEHRLEKPIEVEETYALDEDDVSDKTHIVLGWLLGDSTSLQDMLRAHLMTSVLLDNSASPLRHALETSDLGAAPSPICGLEDSNREMSFICGIEGSNPEQAHALEKLVFDVLNDVAVNGVAQDRVEAVLHQLELSQREIGGDGYPYGLQLILGGLSSAIHGGDPVAVLNLDPVLDQLRKDIQDPEFIKKLVRDNLLNNPHRVRLILKPDTELSQKKTEAEAARLALIKQQLSEQDKQHIIVQAQALEARQNEQDDPGILPKVGLADIPEDISIPTPAAIRNGPRKSTVFHQGTNGLVYQQVIVDLPHLDDELIDLLPYYTDSLTELGCGDMSYVEAQAWQSSVSGGLNAYTSIRGEIDNVQHTHGHFVFSGKALARNHDKLNELMQQSLEKVRFDELEHIHELISQKRARKEQSITGQGHGLAMMAASSGMSPAAALSHRLSGLSAIQYIKALDDGLEKQDSLKSLADKFHTLHQMILQSPRQYLLVAEEAVSQDLSSDLDTYWSDPVIGDFQKFTLPEISARVKQAWITSTQVNFCAKSYATVPIEHEDCAALTVLGGFMRNGFLHKSIREQGGAYGGGASHDPTNACFRFYSYRDPRLTETLDDFDRAIDWILNSDHEYRHLEEAILGVISNIDKPGSPSGEAKQAFFNNLYGRTPEQRRNARKRILSVTIDDLKRVSETYLKPEQASIAVITNKTKESVVKNIGLDCIPL